MSKPLARTIETLMKELNVWYGETFDILQDGEPWGDYNPYRFSEKGVLEDCDGDSSCPHLEALIYGKATVRKRNRWYFVEGERVYFASPFVSGCVGYMPWSCDDKDLMAKLEQGYLFKHRRKAEEKARKMGWLK